MEGEKLTVLVADYADDLRIPPCTNLAVDSLAEVEAAGPELPSPALVPDAVFPEQLTSKRRIRVRRISNETASRMGIQPEQERDEKVMRVPKRLITLLPNLMMRRRIHKEHTKQHNMSGYTPSLRIVDLHRADRSNLVSLHVEEIDVVSGGVDDGVEEHAVSYLSMEPLRLVEREKTELGP